MFALLFTSVVAVTRKDHELAALVDQNEIIEEWPGFGIDLTDLAQVADHWDESAWNNA